MGVGKSYWIHVRLLFTHKNSDFGVFAKKQMETTPPPNTMCVNNFFQFCATAVDTKLDTKNYPL